jgi:hypothetical protein
MKRSLGACARSVFLPLLECFAERAHVPELREHALDRDNCLRSYRRNAQALVCCTKGRLARNGRKQLPLEQCHDFIAGFGDEIGGEY